MNAPYRGGVRSDRVYQITGAQDSTSAEVRARTRKYLISMGVRTACFIAAVLVSGPARWVLLAGALVLPWIAVVVANAGRERQHETPPITIMELNRLALGAAERPGPAKS
jgi:Flp pilus assembly protein TadB